MGGTRVAALIAAHNRRDLTLACLRSLDAQRVPGVTVDAFVLDDGSSDGTSEAVAKRFPEASCCTATASCTGVAGCGRRSPPPSSATTTTTSG